MAMSRSIGARLFTTLPSMLISPELISSRPATMRSVVVLPQPEGPTSTTNSRSRISRFTSLTACVPSNFLLRSLSLTCAMALTLNRPGNAGDVVLDEERIDDGHWDGTDQRAGHERAPEEDVAADELGGHADRHRLLLGRREEHERVDELVPRQCEGEDAGRENARDGDRENDVQHRLPARRAVDARAFLELARDRLEVAHHQPRAEGNQK